MALVPLAQSGTKGCGIMASKKPATAKKPPGPDIDGLMDQAAVCVLNSIIADDPVTYDDDGKKAGGMSAAERAQAFRACVAYWAAKKRLVKKDGGEGAFNGSIDSINSLASSRNGSGGGAYAATDDLDPDPFAE